MVKRNSKKYINQTINLGLGSVYQEKKRGLWICQTYVTDFETGLKKRVKKSFRTQEDAEQYFSEISLQKKSTVYIENYGVPLGKLIEFLLQRKYDSNLITDRGYARTQDTIKSFNNCYLSKKCITEITSEELQEYFNSLTEHYSNSSIQKLFFQIKNAFDYALN